MRVFSLPSLGLASFARVQFLALLPFRFPTNMQTLGVRNSCLVVDDDCFGTDVPFAVLASPSILFCFVLCFLSLGPIFYFELCSKPQHRACIMENFLFS